jgi:hypothetical protein
MVTSLAFGVVFATTIALFLLPSAYLMLEDLKGWRRRRGASRARSSVVEERGSPTAGTRAA